MKKMVIQITPSDYDSDDVWWEDEEKQRYGFGFRSKDDGTFGLTRCPQCSRENYALNVLSGSCTWCPFKITDENETL